MALVRTPLMALVDLCLAASSAASIVHYVVIDTVVVARSLARKFTM